MLTTFEQFLINKERIQEKYVHYYVKWVSDCYRYHNLPESEPLTNEQHAQFLKRLADNAEDWQVRQVERALKLYDYFLLQKIKNETGSVSGQAEDWIIVEKRTREALNAIVFLYRHVLEKDIEGEINSVRARQTRRLPVVMTQREIDSIFREMTGVNLLMAQLIYGCGLRIQECLRLRIKDIDFERGLVIVRAGTDNI